MTTVSVPLGTVLRNRREDFNGRYERARHVFPQLEGETVLEFVRTAFDPLVVAVNDRNPTSVDAVVSAAWDAALARLRGAYCC